jgi:hypothetical protein
VRENILSEGEYVANPVTARRASKDDAIHNINPASKRKPGLCPEGHKVKQDVSRTAGTCSRCKLEVGVFGHGYIPDTRHLFLTTLR